MGQETIRAPDTDLEEPQPGHRHTANSVANEIAIENQHGRPAEFDRALDPRFWNESKTVPLGPLLRIDESKGLGGDRRKLI